MKSTLKMILYAVIGFAASYLALEFLYGRNTDAALEIIYYWLSLVMMVLAATLLIYAFVSRRRLIKLNNDKNRVMNEDDFDAYSYNAFNIITVTTTVALILSLIALAIQTMFAENPWLVGFTVILLFTSFFMNLQASALTNIVYPDRELPEPGDKKYNKKLLAASDEGELFIMAKALYNSWTLTSTLLFFAIIIMVFYSFVTNESQIFSIVIIGLIMIINLLKYSYEIREK